MENSKVIIIAEAGVNHNGDIDMAKRLIDVAKSSGADYVKFQTFKADKLVSHTAKKADYQVINTKEEGSQLDMLKKLELSRDDHHVLIDYCNKLGIKFLSTAFDPESLLFLHSLNLDLWKIPSGEITNRPYLEAIGSFNKKTVLSTGMCTLEEINNALEVLYNAGCDKQNITVLHCTTNYPTPLEEVNLRAMLTIGSTFDISIGYSDHTMGIEVPTAAVALGAKVIEKHFTLDRSLPGPDQLASLEPRELKAMVESIRNIEIALGSEMKEPNNTEKKNLLVARKSIHVNKNLPKGSVLTKEDLVLMRPGDGISPMELNMVIGKRVKRDIEKFKQLKLEDVT